MAISIIFLLATLGELFFSTTEFSTQGFLALAAMSCQYECSMGPFESGPEFQDSHGAISWIMSLATNVWATSLMGYKAGRVKVSMVIFIASHNNLPTSQAAP